MQNSAEKIIPPIRRIFNFVFYFSFLFFFSIHTALINISTDVLDMKNSYQLGYPLNKHLYELFYRIVHRHGKETVYRRLQ